MPRQPLVKIVDDALPPPQFATLVRKVRALGTERLRSTYQTTFWFALDAEASNVVERAIPVLAPHALGKRGRRSRQVTGAEWWLSRMNTHDVRVDFHQDRDEKLALSGGALVHPIVSSVFFLNRVKGGLLAITRELPNEENPSLAPDRLELDLAAPGPNRFAVFSGELTHGVLDAQNQVPTGRLPGKGELRLALIVNWWDHRPTGVPTFAERRVYRALR